MIQMLKIFLVDLKYLSDFVSKEVLENTKYNKINMKVNNLENKIPDVTTTKLGEVENKIPGVSCLVTITAFNKKLEKLRTKYLEHRL